MKFEQKESLKVDNKNRGGFYLESCEPILVGEIHIWHGRTTISQYGEMWTSIYPCYDNGKRAFLMHDVWSPGEHYATDGENEMILNFDEGVKFLLQKGAYAHMFEKS